MGRSYPGMVAVWLALSACGEAKPKTGGTPPIDNVATAPAVVPGVALVEAEVDGAAYARVSGVASAVDEACYETAAVVTGHRDAQGRDWYGVRCGDPSSVYVIVAGASEAGGVAYRPESSQWSIDGLVVHELPGAPLLCATVSWHDEEELREGWDTICLREVSGALAEVFRTGDTSLADGSTSSYQVHAGATEEIHAIVDCDEACDEGAGREVARHVWNGTTFAAQ